MQSLQYGISTHLHHIRISDLMDSLLTEHCKGANTNWYATSRAGKGNNLGRSEQHSFSPRLSGRCRQRAQVKSCCTMNAEKLRCPCEWMKSKIDCPKAYHAGTFTGTTDLCSYIYATDCWHTNTDFIAANTVLPPTALVVLKWPVKHNIMQAKNTKNIPRTYQCACQQCSIIRQKTYQFACQQCSIIRQV